jgi:hypothetical protein
MAKGWLLVCASLAVAAALAVLAYVLRYTALIPLVTLPYALATLGSLIGASAFSARDRMFWAWIAIAIGNATAGAVCFLTGVPPLKTPIGHANAIIHATHAIITAKVVIINVTTVAGLVVFAQAWRSLHPHAGWYRAATGVAFGVGALVAGRSLIDAFHGIALGHTSGWHNAISGVGDLISLTMIGPLAVTAFAMRGATMAWTYVLLTIATLGWLVYDANSALSGEAQIIVDLVTVSIGLVLTGAAGLVHRLALR